MDTHALHCDYSAINDKFMLAHIEHAQFGILGHALPRSHPNIASMTCFDSIDIVRNAPVLDGAKGRIFQPLING